MTTLTDPEFAAEAAAWAVPPVAFAPALTPTSVVGPAVAVAVNENLLHASSMPYPALSQIAH